MAEFLQEQIPLIRDLWRQKDIGNPIGELSVKVNAHGTAFFKVK